MGLPTVWAKIEAQEGELKGKPVKAQFRPMVQFTTGQPKKLSVTLFFDGYEQGKSVRGDCEQLVAFAEMDVTLHRPPEVLFSWEKEQFAKVHFMNLLTWQHYGNCQ